MSDQILLVDDSPEDCELMTRAMEDIRFGHPVQVLNDGREALDYLFCKGPYAGRDATIAPMLVLLDLKMPRVGGLEVLRAVRADRALRYLAVVVLTSSDEEQDRLESQNLGVTFYFRKPLDFDGYVGLARRIQGMLPASRV
jgi:two-component system, response regulator